MRYEVIESKVWIGPNDQKVSIYGSVPYTSEADKKLWSIKTIGYTVYDNVRNTVGVGRVPWKTKEEAEDWVKSQK